jgi:hypothetical protein
VEVARCILTPASVGIQFAGITRGTIRNCTILDNGDDAITLTSTATTTTISKIKVIDNIIEGTSSRAEGACIRVEGTTNDRIIIARNHFAFCKNGGVVANDTRTYTRIKIVENTFYDISRDGADIFNATTIIIDNNIFDTVGTESGYTAIRVKANSDCERIKITNNILYNCGASAGATTGALYLSPETNNINRLIIKNNMFVESNQYGIEFASGNYAGIQISPNLYHNNTSGDITGLPSSGYSGSDSIEGSASYVILTDGTTIYAKNEKTGTTEYSGTVPETVIINAISAVNTAGGGKI